MSSSRKFDCMYLIPKDEYEAQTAAKTGAGGDVVGDISESQVNNIEVSQGGTVVLGGGEDGLPAHSAAAALGDVTAASSSPRSAFTKKSSTSSSPGTIPHSRRKRGRRPPGDPPPGGGGGYMRPEQRDLLHVRTNVGPVVHPESAIEYPLALPEPREPRQSRRSAKENRKKMVKKEKQMMDALVKQRVAQLGGKKAITLVQPRATSVSSMSDEPEPMMVDPPPPIDTVPSSFDEADAEMVEVAEGAAPAARSARTPRRRVTFASQPQIRTMEEMEIADPNGENRQLLHELRDVSRAPNRRILTARRRGGMLVDPDETLPKVIDDEPDGPRAPRRRRTADAEPVAPRRRRTAAVEPVAPRRQWSVVPQPGTYPPMDDDEDVDEDEETAFHHQVAAVAPGPFSIAPSRNGRQRRTLPTTPFLWGKRKRELTMKELAALEKSNKHHAGTNWPFRGYQLAGKKRKLSMAHLRRNEPFHGEQAFKYANIENRRLKRLGTVAGLRRKAIVTMPEFEQENITAYPPPKRRGFYEITDERDNENE